MPPKKKGKKGVNVIVTGATHRQMDTYDKTINGVKYTLFVPQRDCHNEMGKPYSRIINEIARRENYAQNGDEPDKWIAAIQKVFDNHYDEIKDVDGYKEFHQRKVYFLNARAGERGFCTYIAVQRKPYKDQTGDAKKKPKRNKTRKRESSTTSSQKKLKSKGKVSADGSGFIPAASTSSKKGKTKMTPKAKAAKKYMGAMFDSSDPEASDDGWDDVMETLHDRKWNPKTKDYEKMPEMSLGSLGKSSSSSSLELLSESDSGSSKLDYGSDASTDHDDEPTTGWARHDKYERRREKEDAWKKEKEMKEALDDDLLKKVKGGMDIYDAYDEQNKRWQQQQDKEEEETDRYFAEMYGDEDQSSSEGYDSEEDRKRRNEVMNLEYARANGWSKQSDKEGTVFYTHSKSGATVLGNKDGLLEPHLAHAAYDKAMKQKNTMSSGTSSSTMSLPNVKVGPPKPWIQRTSRSTGKQYWWNPVTQVTFYSTKPGGVWTKEEADKAAERAKKKGGKKSRKKKKKTRRKKGGKRKKTKKRKLRKKRKTRR